MNIEIWKCINGYDGKYQISSNGRVRSLNFNKTEETVILKQSSDTYGYKQVTLYKNGKRKTYKVHRLVAETFISNPNKYPQVNHKDENKENNSVKNLEFCTEQYNINYGTRNERVSKELKEKYNDGTFSMYGEKNPMYGRHHTEETKKKISESRKGKYSGQNSPMYGKHHTEETKDKIRNANKGRKLTEEQKLKISKSNKGSKHPNCRKIICITTGEVFNFIKEAAEKYNIDNSGITKCCKGKLKYFGSSSEYGKLQWAYYE